MMPAIVRVRLRDHKLARSDFHRPEEVVAWLGAVQSQDYPGAKWALGLRANGVTDAVVEQAFSDGAIPRTHVLRPTWHFLTPADIRWVPPPLTAMKRSRCSPGDTSSAMDLRRYATMSGGPD